MTHVPTLFDVTGAKVAGYKCNGQCIVSISVATYICVLKMYTCRLYVRDGETYRRLTANTSVMDLLVEVIYPALTRMPGDSHHVLFRAVLLCPLFYMSRLQIERC